MFKIFSAFVICIFVTGCLSTEYQAQGFSGGYSDQMTGPNTATVDFKGNGFTQATVARKFAMRRAAELTLQMGFDYFLVENANNSTKQVKMGSNIRCNTIGYSTTCNDYGGGTIEKPGSSLDIRMYKGKTPNQTGHYDARYLISQ